MKNIVIIGAGFAGLLSALKLEKQFHKQKDVSITLIDRHNYQLFTPNLYEVATADEEFTSVSQLNKSIAVPLSEVLRKKSVNFIQASVGKIDRDGRTVQAGNKYIHYDYLLVASGSISDYFSIPGADQFALPLKTLPEALAIRNRIEFAFQARRYEIHKPVIHLVVAGGGYTGVEFAAELSRFCDLLAWKNQYPPEKIETTLIEAAEQLVLGFSERFSRDVLARIRALGIRVELSSFIAAVEEGFVELATGERLPYDVLVWTTGVRAESIAFNAAMACDRKSRLQTNEYLQLKDDDHVFALGDTGCVLNTDGHPAPATAEDAIAQAEYLGYALPLIMRNQRPQPYRGKSHGFIVALGGKWAIMDYGGLYWKGYFAYLAREFSHWNYFRKILGWWKALKWVVLQIEVYSRND